MLNPQVANRTIQDIVLQMSYHFKDMKELPQAVKSLQGINYARSWGDLAQKAAKAVKPLDGALKDVIPHIKTRVNLYSEANANKVMGQEYVSGAAGAGAMAKAALGTTLSPLISLGAPIAAGALGALAIRNAKKKFDTEIDSYTTESNERHQELMKAIKAKRKK